MMVKRPFLCGTNAEGGGGARGRLVTSSKTTILCFTNHETNNVIMCLSDLCGAIVTLGKQPQVHLSLLIDSQNTGFAPSCLLTKVQ